MYANACCPQALYFMVIQCNCSHFAIFTMGCQRHKSVQYPHTIQITELWLRYLQSAFCPAKIKVTITCQLFLIFFQPIT